jgi:23S rRNA (adenine2503-C2)-methyltransferase
MTGPRQDPYGLSRTDLAAWLTDRGHPRFRADQVFHWLHSRLARSFADMTDLPAALREELAEAFLIGPYTPAAVSEAPDSTKLLLPLEDGETVECVHMRTGRHTASLCVSSQVGCAIRCEFCASGSGGFLRNLTAGEIVRQAVTLQTTVGPARNLVLMGMGEPLHNLDAVLPALAVWTDPRGWGLSPQRITLATSGVARGIRRLSREGPAIELALSLNAPEDVLRRRLMPGVRDALADVLAACDEFSERHGGQPVTFAYVLLRGMNDRPEHAAGLVHLLAHRRHHLNVIPYNAVEGKPFEEPSDAEARKFVHWLRSAGLNVSLRRSHGRGINAACGQLRRRASPPGPGGTPPPRARPASRG